MIVNGDDAEVFDSRDLDYGDRGDIAPLECLGVSREAKGIGIQGGGRKEGLGLENFQDGAIGQCEHPRAFFVSLQYVGV